MKVFTCTDHDGVWPVGVCSVIVALSEEAARLLLAAELVSRHLKPDNFTLQELDLSQPKVTVLLDGDY